MVVLALLFTRLLCVPRRRGQYFVQRNVRAIGLRLELQAHDGHDIIELLDLDACLACIDAVSLALAGPSVKASTLL